MHILNFSHPLTPKHLEQIHALVGTPPEKVHEIKVHLDVSQAFAPQVIALVDGLDITPLEWQSTPWLIVLPSLNYGAAVLLAELHGRIGHFPSILRLRPIQNALVTEFEIAEIINLEQIRTQSRAKR
jgi:hypothetical protein